MEGAAALNVAVDLIRVPSRVRRLRSRPLPEGVVILLRIAAGDQAAEQEAAAWTGRTPVTIREAAIFFIEQILLAPDADSYRVLGVEANATTEDLRRNMALLLKGMHPDRMNGDRTLFARRVTSAWNALKTPERRSAYDAAQERSGRESASSAQKGGGGRRGGKQGFNQRTTKFVPARKGGRALDLYRPGPSSALGRVFRFLFSGVRY